MVLCELAAGHDLSPVALWLVLTALGLLSILPASGAVFYAQYVRRSYAQWRWKTLPAYPSAADVRLEVLATLKGIAAATVPPTLSIYLSARGYSQGYCGVEPHGYGYLLASFMLAFVASDCYEWAYHRLGHTSALGWAIHKHHHKFHNPSPFAVIADEPPDQFVRALPLLVMPLLMPTNMDMVRMCVCVCMCVSHASHNAQHTSPMHHTRTHTHTRTHFIHTCMRTRTHAHTQLFATYAVIFYVYGVYLHCGHELEYPDAHHPILNTSFQHCIHHALSVRNVPYHTGFFFKIWDDMLGAVHPGCVAPGHSCRCAKCACLRGHQPPRLSCFQPHSSLAVVHARCLSYFAITNLAHHHRICALLSPPTYARAHARTHTRTSARSRTHTQSHAHTPSR